MPLATGLAGQFGLAIETTYGTAVTVTRFLPMVSESIEQNEERLAAESILAGRRVMTSEQWELGAIDISGDVELEFHRQGMGGLWLAAFGTVTSVSASGATTHTYTPGDLEGRSLTLQVGRPQRNGVVTPFTYAGSKVATWEITAEEGSVARVTFGFVAQSVTTGTALATVTYQQGVRSYVFHHGYAVVAGTTTDVRAFTVSGDNGLITDRRRLGARAVLEPIEGALREVTGSLTMEWQSTTDYQRFVNGTEATVVLGLSASTTESAIVTMNVRYDGYPVNVEGADLVVSEVAFMAVASTSADSSAITLAVRNAQTSSA